VEESMKISPEIRLDILIKKEEDYWLAHCLQFDLVVTEDSIEEAKKAIFDCCIAHIIFSIENDNMEFLFSPAPQESWAEYLEFMNNPDCITETGRLDIPKEKALSIPALPPFMIQEILCNEQSSCRT